jgi:phosphoribosylformylglycinamidine synthase subunit PurSL
MLWEVDIHPASGRVDLTAKTVAADAADLGLSEHLSVVSAHGYLVQGELDAAQMDRIAGELLSDPVVERTVVAQVGDDSLAKAPPRGGGQLIHVLSKPGVTDTVAESASQAIADFGFTADAVKTFKKYWVDGLSEDEINRLCAKLLANDAIEQVVIGPLDFDELDVGSEYVFKLTIVPIRSMSDDELATLSIKGQLYLSLTEMQTIQARFVELDRDPTDVELETVAQTWSEHCSHKTLAGRIRYQDENGERTFKNMLKETIFEATMEIRRRLGDDDWCVSVFSDNAGVVTFDETYNVCFKVETHNHPSALEPYGGANTGIGGVIRDPMGTGMGSKPVCNTDVFCFAPPETEADSLPSGVLHPRRVMKGVVSGVRDYGNRMGIPTVNGAVYFDPRYLGNPLVYCGNVGIMPIEMSFSTAQAGDLIVAIGGRTGRDGIHGATFSSAELTSESETLSGGAVQIGNAITEKMVLDVMLVARDRGLYNAVTDCGAGGFSSAVGEMGEEIGAEVELDAIPLKYDGLSYTEMWISEAQERMVFSVPQEHWDEFRTLCESEGVEAVSIGTFQPTGNLVLNYEGNKVCELTMKFLHDGRPPVVREAVYAPTPETPLNTPPMYVGDYGKDLASILGSLNVASKHWIVRQYDHEVQGGSVIKPLVGVENDGPGDAAVVRPRIDSQKALVMSCGMNPCYGDFDTYWMAASAIDEAVRNCVAVGGDPSKIAILDNFCWGTTDQPFTLGSLVRSALACYDLAVGLGTPFISGKDSLNNEFRPEGSDETISIPPSLLISAMGQVDDASQCVTMDLKQSGNFIYQIGATHAELGGSHFAKVRELAGGQVPKVDIPLAKKTFAALHGAIKSGLVRSCHDMSEGGLAAAIAEMAFSGEVGARVFLGQIPNTLEASDESKAQVEAWSKSIQHETIHPLAATPDAATVLLFSESNTRFLVEVEPDNAQAFRDALGDVPVNLIGETVDTGKLEVVGIPAPASGTAGDQDPEITAPLLIQAELATLKKAWQDPLDW